MRPSTLGCDGKFATRQKLRPFGVGGGGGLADADADADEEEEEEEAVVLSVMDGRSV